MAMIVEAVEGLVKVSRTENYEYTDLVGRHGYLPVSRGIILHPEEAATLLDPKKWGGVINKAKEQMKQERDREIAKLEVSLAKLKGTPL